MSFDASFRLSFEASDVRSDAPSFDPSDARSDAASIEMSDGRSDEVSFRTSFSRRFPANSETSFLASFQGSFEERDKGIERPRDRVVEGMRTSSGDDWSSLTDARAGVALHGESAMKGQA